MSQDLLAAVGQYIDRQTGESPFSTPVTGLFLLRSAQEKRPTPMVLKPALCMVLQGAKWTTFGDRRFEYRAGQMLVVSLEMPAVGRVVEASPTEPYLGITIELDLTLMRAVLEELDAPPTPSVGNQPGVFVTSFEHWLTDCALRMVRLLDTPYAISTLYPGIMREICFWLLTGRHGGEIVRMMMANGKAQRVVNAIHLLRDRFAEALRVEELAEHAQMSASAFHRQFKALTSMTPLQYQKQLRLLEARRLMVSTAFRAEEAAFQVGYESASQFSREYSRMFGSPPRRHSVSLISGQEI